MQGGFWRQVKRVVLFVSPAVCSCFGYNVSRGMAIASGHVEAHFGPGSSRAPFLTEENEAARRIHGVISRIVKGTAEDVIEWLQRDHGCSEIQLSVSLVDGVSGGFGDDWKSALGFFRWASSRPGYTHTSGTYNKMVDLLGKMKQFDGMMELVHEMRLAGIITVETVSKVMRRFAGAGRWEDAMKVFDDLETMGIKKNTKVMNILLDTLCKEKFVEAARGIFLELKKDISPDAHTFNIFVHGWCKVNRIDEAEWTVVEMKGYGFRPSDITYSTIIEAHCRYCSFTKVYKLLDYMHAEGCPPNVVTYTIVMHALAKSEEYEAALNMVDRMRSAGCEPDIVFYNSLIYVLGRAGRLSEASHVFENDMLSSRIAPNLSTYNTMISMFCHHSCEQDALKVLEKMEHTFCKPDLVTYTPLLKLCFKKGKTDDLFCLLMNDIVNKHHLCLDLATYTLLVHGLCRAGKYQWALLLFEEMVNQEIPPRSRTCNLLLDEAEKLSMYATVDKIKDLIEKNRKTLIPAR